MPIPWWSTHTVNMEPDYSDPNSKNYRYCLEGCASGKEKALNPLIIIALNPSTADEKLPDDTMKRVVPYMEINGFDGFVMLNLYPLRSTNPKVLKGIVIDPEIRKKTWKQYVKK